MNIKCNIISYSLDDEDLLASSNSGVATRGPDSLVRTGPPDRKTEIVRFDREYQKKTQAQTLEGFL